MVLLACSAARGACTGSCDLDVVQPVCGKDGITYQRECLATCQGVKIAKRGPCLPDEGKMFAASGDTSGADAAAAATVSADTLAMNMFTAEGFKLVGRGRGSADFKAVPPEPRAIKGLKNAKRGAVRYVPATGHVYVAMHPNAPAAAAGPIAAGSTDATTTPVLSDGFDPSKVVPQPVPDSIMLANNSLSNSSMGNSSLGNGSIGGNDTAIGTGRKLLLVFEPDGRYPVGSASSSFPWSAVGRLDFSWTSTPSGCSGTLISHQSVLTAAHCLYNFQRKVYATNVRFSADGSYSPWGTVPLLFYTVPYQYPVNGDADYDYAMVTLPEPVGRSAGYLGLWISDSWSEQLFYSAGYPETLPGGGFAPRPKTMWAQTCLISDSVSSDTNWYTKQCDFVTGQSGSAIWRTPFSSGNPYIAGVVSRERESTGENLGPQMTRELYHEMLAWSGYFTTAWNWGDPPAWRNPFLDRHDLSPCTSQTGLRDFQMEVDNASGNIRFRYNCAPLPTYWYAALGPAKYFTTPRRTDGGGLINALDMHEVVCPFNHVLTRWRLAWYYVNPPPSQLSFHYYCAERVPAPAVPVCEVRYTPWADVLSGQSRALASHQVWCPSGSSGSLLTGFRLQTAWPKIRFMYSCCR